MSSNGARGKTCKQAANEKPRCFGSSWRISSVEEERERERHGETKRQKDIDTERQRDIETERPRDRVTEKHRNGEHRDKRQRDRKT